MVIKGPQASFENLRSCRSPGDQKTRVLQILQCRNSEIPEPQVFQKPADPRSPRIPVALEIRVAWTTNLRHI